MGMEKLEPDRFDEIVYDNGAPCLVVFSRQNCHVCQEVVPVLEELAPKYEGRFGFYYVDVEEQKQLLQQFSLRGVPQILFFKEGEYQGRKSGSIEAAEIAEKITEILG